GTWTTRGPSICYNAGLATARNPHEDYAMSRTSRYRLAIPATLAIALACIAPASADVLLVDRAHAKPQTALPARGASAAQVEARFGAPAQKLQPRGGQK